VSDVEPEAEHGRREQQRDEHHAPHLDDLSYRTCLN
jgi:hypothetical protein